MELRHLITFKTIVDRGGFKKAAEHLGYAQSSVTIHMKELEKEVGKPLFDRLGKKVVLNYYGKQLLPYAIKIIELYAQAKDVLNTDDEPAGDLVIGASESLTLCRLPSILFEYRKKYPKVNLSLKSLDHNDITKSLQNGDIDLIFILERDNWSSAELYSEKIKTETMVLISPLEYEENNDTVLYTEGKCSYKSVFDDYLDHHDIEVKESLDFSSIETIKQCVISGLGISMLPYFSVKNELDEKKIEGEIIGTNQSTVATFLTYHKDKWVSPAMNSMISMARRHAQSWI
ncbi:LysR family transcriptional regulator [Bacillus atrophaeus]|uniref:LysR family transcriptional regulator n=1 Tax=Bacillus atrophaeus TaxID=1452 RepID=UPI002E1B529E|nr:LysR family transcriptional regulator [Bacillus atrophaeus]